MWNDCGLICAMKHSAAVCAAAARVDYRHWRTGSVCLLTCNKCAWLHFQFVMFVATSKTIH